MPTDFVRSTGRQRPRKSLMESSCGHNSSKRTKIAKIRRECSWILAQQPTSRPLLSLNSTIHMYVWPELRDRHHLIPWHRTLILHQYSFSILMFEPPGSVSKVLDVFEWVNSSPKSSHCGSHLLTRLFGITQAHFIKCSKVLVLFLREASHFNLKADRNIILINTSCFLIVIVFTIYFCFELPVAPQTDHKLWYLHTYTSYPLACLAVSKMLDKPNVEPVPLLGVVGGLSQINTDTPTDRIEGVLIDADPRAHERTNFGVSTAEVQEIGWKAPQERFFTLEMD